MATADDLLAMPNGKMYELVRGEIVPRPISSFESSTVAVTIVAALGDFVQPRKLGGLTGADGGYILARNPDTVRVMDAAFVRSERLPPRETWDHFLELAPDLAVEVVSPSDSANGVHDKVIEYLDAGVRMIWVVHPIRQTVTVYTPDRTARVLSEGDTLDGGDVLPGFTLAIAEIFT